MAYLTPNQKEIFEKKLATLNALRPFPPVAVRKLREHLQIEMTYNSNAIEGNSLTLKETFLVINEGITVRGKPLKDHLEAKNHAAALEYLYDVVDKDKNHTVSERLIRTLHELVVQETEKEWAGRYRSSNVFIGGASHTPPDAFEVPALMNELMQWLHKSDRKLHRIELAALFHHKLVHIHPFFDGNGRTARLAMNVLLMQSGYPLAIILKNDRKHYYRVLDRADQGDFEPLIRFVARAVERSLDIYLKSLTPASKNKEVFLPLSTLSQGSPYSAKYLNLLIRQGKLEAHKEGRNWLTTKEALERYRERRLRKR